MSKFHFPALGLLSAFALPALADVTFSYQVEGDGEGVEAIMIGDGRLRINQHGAETWSLFDAAADAIYIIDDGKREYTMIDRAVIDRFSDLPGLLEQQMDDALARVPEAQRLQARVMMEGMMKRALKQARADIPQRSARPTGDTRTVAGYRCTITEVYVDDQKEFETCSVPPDTLDLPPADMAVIERLQTFAEYAVTQAESVLGTALIDISDFALKEIPIQTRYFDRGDRHTTTTLESIADTALDAALLRVPEGYRERTLELPRL